MPARPVMLLIRVRVKGIGWVEAIHGCPRLVERPAGSENQLY